jgi:hypothetical protein
VCRTLAKSSAIIVSLTGDVIGIAAHFLEELTMRGNFT